MSIIENNKTSKLSLKNNPFFFILGYSVLYPDVKICIGEGNMYPKEAIRELMDCRKNIPNSVLWIADSRIFNK